MDDRGRRVTVRDKDTEKDDKIVSLTETLGDEIDDGEPQEEDFDETMRRHRARLRAGTLLLAGVAAVVLVYIFVIRPSRPYALLDEVYSETIPYAAGQNYVNMGGGILQYGYNGAAYYSVDDKHAWSVVYSMEDPKAAVCGDWALVYDRDGRSAIVFSAQGGKAGEISTNQPIRAGTVSGYGAVSLVQEDGLSNDIMFYSKEGKKLDILIHTMAGESGYPIDICLSPDGQMLIASYVYIDSGVMQNQIVFYNFDTTKNSGTQTVGAYRKYGDTLFADVAFISNDRAVACGDGKVVFYSLKNRTAPAELAVIEPQSTITALTYSASGVSMAVTDGDSVQNHFIVTYDSNGKELYKVSTNFTICDMQYTKNGVYITGPGSLLYLDKKGRSFFKGSLETSVDKLSNAGSSPAELFIIGGGKYSYIKLVRR